MDTPGHLSSPRTPAAVLTARRWCRGRGPPDGNSGCGDVAGTEVVVRLRHDHADGRDDPSLGQGGARGVVADSSVAASVVRR